MSSTSKRLLAAVLCVLMTLGLFVPAGAAPATLGEQYAVVEIPVGDDDAIVAQPAAAGDIVMADERPVAVDQDEAATLLATSTIYKEGGWLESAYIEWTIADGVSKYEVSVKEKSASTWAKLDDQLIRRYPGNVMRADALGLKAGTYQMKVTPNTGAEMTSGDLVVKAHDRSGYAFVGGTASGAYNEDGTLKSNANVVYITQDTASTVTLDVDVNGKGVKTTMTGLPGILLGYKKGKDKTPLCIRFVGTVANDYSQAKTKLPSPWSGVTITGKGPDSAATNLNDSTFKGDVCLDGLTGGVTLEGVGMDATLIGIGLRVKNSSNVEIRNLGIMNVNSGELDNIGFQPTCDHVWAHNNDIFYGMPGKDDDQVKGDGALDTKGVKYASMSYNHFWDVGKSNLCGLNNNMDCLTYHHNWYDHSDSRHPRIRYAQHVHIYNNYYDGNAKYGVGATTGSSVFVENNFFRNCNHPVLISMQGTDKAGGGTFSSEAGGMIKMYGNYIEGGKPVVSQAQNATEFDAYIAASKDEKVPDTYKTLKGGTTYNNFDTASDFYKYSAQTASDARDSVMQYAGRVEGGDVSFTFNNAVDDASYDINAALSAQLKGYESKLVSVGGAVDGSVSSGDEHDHSYGPYTVKTQPTCTTNGVEERTCQFPSCGQVDTREIPGGHKYVDGVCTVCKEKEPEGGGNTSVVSGSAKTLQASDFKLAAPLGDDSKRSPLPAEELAKVADGYFTMVGKVEKRIPKAGKVGDTVTHFDLMKDGSNGFQFTVSASGAPATLTASFSSTGDKNTSALILVKEDGTKVKNSGNAEYATQKTTKATTVTFNDLAAGTYIIKGSEDGGAGSDARLYYATVTETVAAHEHQWSAWTEVRAATCGEDGLRQRACSECGKTETDSIDATGEHTWGAWVTNADGEKTRECSICGEEENEAGEVVTPTPVNTKGLEDAIAAAEKLTAVKVDTAAANVDKGVFWVTKSVMDALKSAIATAKALDATKADQAAVDNAAKTLNAAVDTFMAAVQEGAKESGGTSTGTVHTFESKTLTKADAANAASGAYTDDNYFTLAPAGKAKYDESSKEWTAEAFGNNAYDPSGDHAQSKVIRFNMGGKSDSKNGGPGIKFTTTADTATIQIWWVQGGGDKYDSKTDKWSEGDIRQIQVLKTADYTAVAASKLAHAAGSTLGGEGRIKANDPEYTELTISTAGEYMVGSLDSGNYIFKIVVTEGASGGTTPTPVDKSALDKAIDDAVAAIAKPTVSTDGKDVEPTAKWVTQAQKDTFQAAITAAKAAKLTAASDAEVTAAVGALNAAKTAFEDAQANGTKGQGNTPSDPINPDDPPEKDALTLSRSAVSVQVNNTATVTATVTGYKGKSLLAISDNTGVATVSVKNKTITVTGKAEGDACVYVVMADTQTVTLAAAKADPSMKAIEVTVTKANTTPGFGGGGGGGGGSKKDPEPPTPTTTLPFVDVADSAWYASGVKKVYDLGLMKGTDATHFNPDDSTTRAMVATVLFRLNGEKKGDVHSAFADVASGQWYSDAIDWASQQGVVNGDGKGNFAPDDNVTREQVAVMLYRYANPTAVSAEGLNSRFTDADRVSDWAKDAIAWAVASGIINGKGDGTLDPQGLATRAEICTMLIRFVELKK